MEDGPPHLVEERTSGEKVYGGVLLHVHRDSVRLPNGAPAVREYIDHPGAVAIVPMLDGDTVLLERQFRYPHGRVMVEIPAGKIDPGEAPLQTARRELREETGRTASEWRHLATIHPLVAYSNEHIELFLATGLLAAGEAALDPGEFLETFTLPLSEALEWIRAGGITDSKTVIGLMWAERLRARQWQ
ncbi:MAG: NUDIX hydrolase [Gammaproteobacteria bacterium]|nr:NUDIX hydrolase [Gammaproteobacteria bacterium]